MSTNVRSDSLVLASWLLKWLLIKDLGELGQLEIQVHSETASRIDFEIPEVD